MDLLKLTKKTEKKEEEKIIPPEEEEEESIVIEEEKPKTKVKAKRRDLWYKLNEYRIEMAQFQLSEIQLKIIYFIRYFNSPFPRHPWTIANYLYSEEEIIKRELKILLQKVPFLKEVDFNQDRSYILQQKRAVN